MSAKTKRGLWSPDAGPRNLSKAKSSPNVSKTVKEPAKPVRSVKAREPPNRCPPEPAKTTKTTTPKSNQPEKKKQTKPTARPPPSCTILEDRALLKKGLQATPDKPKKPDELKTIKKSPLNRTGSLWSVQTSAVKGQAQKATEPPKPSKVAAKKPQVLKRSTSLWSVSPEKKSLSLRPSRIPLSTHNHSLLNLSLSTPVECADRDETDRSIDERVYENTLSEESSGPIYENIKPKDDEKKENTCPSKQVSKGNLEKRAELLMSRLDEDEKPVGGKSREASGQALLKTRSLAKSHEVLSRRHEPELCIQEIRKNWERQIHQSQEAKPKVSASSKSVPTQKTTEIKELVKFFNCKNVEISNSVQNWKKDLKEDKNGYTSDGNCSEDSGHISNENDLEPHENGSKESIDEKFIKGVIEDLDENLRTIEVFRATPVNGFEETEERGQEEKSLNNSNWDQRTDSNGFQDERMKGTTEFQIDDNVKKNWQIRHGQDKKGEVKMEL